MDSRYHDSVAIKVKNYKYYMQPQSLRRHSEQDLGGYEVHGGLSRNIS